MLLVRQSWRHGFPLAITAHVKAVIQGRIKLKINERAGGRRTALFAIYMPTQGVARGGHLPYRKLRGAQDARHDDIR